MVRFGQQTNICVGIQLIEDYVVAVTVDGVIRTFSIRKRDIVSQYKVAELGKQADLATRARLKDVGGGTGGMGMITWFQAQGKSMTVSAWNTEPQQCTQGLDSVQRAISLYVWNGKKSKRRFNRMCKL